MELGMKKIIIISSSNNHSSQFSRVVKGLFPDCKVTVASKENGKIEKGIKKGDQYAEYAERR